MSETPASTIEQDIAQLEKQLQEKKSILEHQVGGNPTGKAESIPAEKEIVRSIVGEKITQQVPTFQPTTLPSISSTGGEPPSYLDPALRGKVDQLVAMVFSTNLVDGIMAAAKEDNPALMDAFHDILSDELYNTLVQKRKLEKVE